MVIVCLTGRLNQWIMNQSRHSVNQTIRWQTDRRGLAWQRDPVIWVSFSIGEGGGGRSHTDSLKSEHMVRARRTVAVGKGNATDLKYDLSRVASNIFFSPAGMKRPLSDDRIWMGEDTGNEQQQ